MDAAIYNRQNLPELQKPEVAGTAQDAESVMKSDILTRLVLAAIVAALALATATALSLP